MRFRFQHGPYGPNSKSITLTIFDDEEGSCIGSCFFPEGQQQFDDFRAAVQSNAINWELNKEYLVAKIRRVR